MKTGMTVGRGLMKRWFGLICMTVVIVAPAPHLSARQAPVPLNINGEQEKIPDSLRPEWTDTQGRPTKSIQIDSYTMDQQIEIDRVVSYAVDESGRLKSDASFDGVVSRNAKITVWACITTDNPEGVGIPVQIAFQKFNDLPISNTLTCNLISDRFYRRGAGFSAAHWFVSTTRVKFARAGFDPMTAMLRWPNYKLSPASPGLNDLQFQVVVDPRYQTQRIGHIVIHLFAYIDFDAIAPIILVHGTAAQADSWRQPNDGVITINGDYANIRPFVSASEGGTGFFDTNSVQANLNPVPWFAGVNLGTVYKPDGVTVDKDKSGNQYFKDAAKELSVEVSIILNALGVKKFHIVAHSKGGTDVRKLILDRRDNGFSLAPLSNNQRDVLQENYKMLSLYTLGTPHKGTPSANLSECVNVEFLPVLNSWDGNLDRALGNDAEVAAAMQAKRIGPQGGALADQMVGSSQLFNLNSSASLNEFSQFLGDHFYNLVGDADLNADKAVTYEEAKALLPEVMQGNLGYIVNYRTSLCDSMYQLTGKVCTIDAQKSPNLHPGYIVLTPHPFDPSQASLLWPNDLVTPVWSGYLSGIAKPLVLTPDQSLSFKPRSGNFGNYSGVLSGGNHALIHRYDAAEMILKQIEADYPIQEPQ